jgi:hypothetical protein
MSIACRVLPATGLFGQGVVERSLVRSGHDHPHGPVCGGRWNGKIRVALRFRVRSKTNGPRGKRLPSGGATVRLES